MPEFNPGSTSVNRDLLTNQLENLQKGGKGDKEVRLKITKTGKIEIRTDQARGKLGHFGVHTGAVKKKGLREQQALGKLIIQLNPLAKTSLKNRTVITVDEALKALSVKGQKKQEKTPPSDIEFKQLNQIITEGLPKADSVVKDKLAKIDDLEFVSKLQNSLAPLARGNQLPKTGQPAYKQVQFRVAELTGVKLAQEALNRNDPHASENIQSDINATKFSSRTQTNKDLQKAALNTAKQHLEQHSSSLSQPVNLKPKPAPNQTNQKHRISNQPSSPVSRNTSDTLADYYLRSSRQSVTDTPQFREKFAAGIQQQVSEGKSDRDALNKAARQIQEEGDPVYDVDGASELVSSIIAEVSTITDPVLLNKHRFNALKKRTDEIFKTIELITPRGARFKNVKSPLKTNVPVSVPNEKGVVTSQQGQIHANYVTVTGKSTAIATQYPKETPQDMEMFWRMAVQQGTKLVVDLTQPADGLAAYYPTDPKNPTLDYGDVTVKLTADHGNNYFTYEIEDKSTRQTHTLNRYNAAHWKDKTSLGVDDFSNLVAFTADSQFDNITVHCKAGIGRTTTLMAGIELLENMRNGEIARDDIDSAVDAVILDMRTQRGPNGVQTADQRAQLVETVQLWFREGIPD